MAGLGHHLIPPWEWVMKAHGKGYWANLHSELVELALHALPTFPFSLFFPSNGSAYKSGSQRVKGDGEMVALGQQLQEKGSEP